jgi:hypothetical protein
MRTEMSCHRCRWRSARHYTNAGDVRQDPSEAVYWTLRGYCMDCAKWMADRFSGGENA